MGKETKLQSQIVVWFSQERPEERGCLFHVSNERNSPLQAFQARAIGIFPGVADLLYFSRKNNSIHVTGIEVKAKGERHSVDHIKNQVEWGKKICSLGGEWFLVTSLEQAINIFNGKKDGLTVDEVEELISNIKTKTIVF